MRKTVEKLFYSAIQAVDPEQLIMNNAKRVKERLHIGHHVYELSFFTRILVLSMGKASVPMARGMENILGSSITDGLVITHHREELRYLPVMESSHPLPDERSLEAGRRIRALCQSADAHTLVIVLISGGASALCEDSSFPLSSLIEVTDLLLRSGVSIQESNSVRQQLSRIKGGNLMKNIWPAESVSLILSDVVGDEVSFIASGPTVMPITQPSDALKVLEKYRLHERVPPEVVKYLRKQKDDLPEKIFSQSQVVIVGNTRTATQQIAHRASTFGYPSLVLSSTFTGEARVLGEFWAALAESVITHQLPQAPPLCMIGGGESTVTLCGSGKGGRNQELALAFLQSCLRRKLPSSLCFLSASTDGRDGPTDAAGAIVTLDKHTADDLPRSEQALSDNDSYHFFKRTEDLLITGPTKTNVCDLQILLLGSNELST